MDGERRTAGGVDMDNEGETIKNSYLFGQFYY